MIDSYHCSTYTLVLRISASVFNARFVCIEYHYPCSIVLAFYSNAPYVSTFIVYSFFFDTALLRTVTELSRSLIALKQFGNECDQRNEFTLV